MEKYISFILKAKITINIYIIILFYKIYINFPLT